MVFCLIFMFCFSYVTITHPMELSILATSLSISSLHVLDSGFNSPGFVFVILGIGKVGVLMVVAGM